VRLDPVAARRHLAETDPRLHRYIEAHRARHGDCPLAPRPVRSLFPPLARSIVYQQLSGAAAGTIHGRFLDLFPGRRPSAARLLALDDGALRAVGLSAAKVRALRDLAEHVRSRALPAAAQLAAHDDAALIERLTRVRGIGPWTVQMFLMFWLARPDVLPVDDLGIRKGLMLIDGLDALPSAAEVEARGAVWRPWATLASWYLWRRTETAAGLEV
jgi:3-methyladenine DNA glycosylase/8-oxoguanine DNA glycosylase